MARIHTKIVARIRVDEGQRIGVSREDEWVMKRMEVRSLINRIMVYSAMKIIAKVLALYSMLNPETSSDSPSAKSNGVRFVSARIEVNHTGARGRRIRIFGVVVLFRMCVISNDRRRRRGESMIKAILTSYEIVWATPRIAPRRAYFELENHPAARVV